MWLGASNGSRRARWALWLSAGALAAVVGAVIGAIQWVRVQDTQSSESCHSAPVGTGGKGGKGAMLATTTAFAPTDAGSLQPVSPEGHSPTGHGVSARNAMVKIPAGTYWVGAQSPTLRDALPVHRVRLDSFAIDETEVTNGAYAEFVRATGYVTVAERAPRAEDFPNVPRENLVAGSAVFYPTEGPVPLDNHLRWWRYVRGAQWRYPLGTEVGVTAHVDHPVVHVAYEDAEAYCRWRGKRLPTETEFEVAARGGLDRRKYVWGDDLTSEGKWLANIWQGAFPHHNTREDGFQTTAPVKSFPPNGYGLFDMAGNVWEWCSDWYRHDEYARRTAGGLRNVVANPVGPQRQNQSTDPSEPGVAKRVQRGGSFLCTDEYCSAYMPGARGKGAPDTGTNHVGFRCARSATNPSGS